jgi:hypothetical protein
VADLRTLTLALVADVDKFKKGLDKADGETRSFSDKLDSALKKGALAFAAIGAAAGAFAIKIGKDAINAASEFTEQLSKSEAVLGDGAKQVQKFAEQAARSLGQSRTEALRAASNFAIFGKSAGLSGQELAKFSTDFVTLASDLASFNDTSPEDAVQALGAALRGESEPIRRYGVLLNEATLKNRALELGIIDNIKNALTPQQKVLAAQAEIFAQTSDAQGDFARTSDGLANTQRQLTAEIENLKISLGESLLPAALSVATFFKEELIPRFKGLVDAITGKPSSLTTALEEGRRRLQGFEAEMFLAEQQGFRLGESYKSIGDAIVELANRFRFQVNPDSGFSKFTDILIKINETIASIIRNINILVPQIGILDGLLNVAQKIGAAVGVGPVSPSDRIVADLAANQRQPNTQPIVINYTDNSLIPDPQKTARTIASVISRQRGITGVAASNLAARGFF